LQAARWRKADVIKIYLSGSHPNHWKISAGASRLLYACWRSGA
jgi:hypothetical protein